MEYVNKVKLYGKVSRDIEYSHEFEGVPFYSIELETPKIKSNKKNAYVRCYFRGEQLAQEEIKPGSLIVLTGKFINSKVKGIIDISVLVDDYKIIDQIPEDDFGEVEVSGEVTKIFTNKDNYKGLTNFVIADIDENGKKLFSTRVVIWGRLSDHIFNNLNIGDKVLVRGIVNNSKTQSKVEGESESVLVSEVLGFYFTKL